jgi:two-component system, NtrC family, sensor histidine kinase HydH
MNASEILAKVIEMSNAPIEADRRLANLVDTVASIFSIPLCTFFLWEPYEARLVLKFASAKHPVFLPGLNFTMGEGPLGTCLMQKVPIILTDASQLSPADPEIPPDFAGFRFLAFYPIVDDISLYGVLALTGEEPRELSVEERFLFVNICRQLAGTIRGSQIALQAKKRIAALSTLNAIGMATSSTTELGELLNRITLSSTKILRADGCILRLLDEKRMLNVVSSFGLDEEIGVLDPLPLGEQVAGLVALNGEPILIRDVQNSPLPFTPFSPKISSAICVPLIYKSKTIGTLSLFSNHQEGRQEKIFDEEDRNLLSTMASQITNAIENATILQRAERLAKDKEHAIQELSLLYEVSRSMLTTIRLDQLLHIILISVTLGNPMGFDRAALFLVEEKEKVLKGMIGVGPKTRAEADSWRQKLKEQHIFSSDWVPPEEMEITPYEMKLKEVQISLEETNSVLVKTVLEKRPFNIENAATNPEVNPEILTLFGGQAFASVPLIAKGKSIGLIAVDNFLTGIPITSAELGFLTLLANQAALAIENSRLYGNLQDMNTQLLQTQNRLIQSEKLAALGEVVASITHEIKNPLVSIGGFARRLDRNLQDDSPEKKYMRIVLKEVNRLENFLDKTLMFSKESLIPSGHGLHNLNRIIEDTLSILDNEFQDRNIALQKELDENLPSLFSDPQQIKQVFLNLFVNAMQAIAKDGRLFVKTSTQHRGDILFIQVEVGDTGGGIPLEILDNIFNPFFTTKQEGTGLGLAIAHKIVTQHRGEIEVVNHPGVGATFLIRFPLPE